MGVRLLTLIGQTVFWCALLMGIPAALLYPAVVWMLKNTQYSENSLIQGYLLGIAVLFIPTGFLVDFLYRRFIRRK